MPVTALDRLEARVAGLRRNFDTSAPAQLNDMRPVVSVLADIVAEMRELRAAIEARADD